MTAFCMTHLTTMTRHADGYLHTPKIVRSKHRLDLHPLLDRIWVYRIGNEEGMSIVVNLHLRRDGGFLLHLPTQSTAVAAAASRRLREYLKSAGIQEGESYILAGNIIESAVDICTLHAAESEAA